VVSTCSLTVPAAFPTENALVLSVADVTFNALSDILVDVACPFPVLIFLVVLSTPLLELFTYNMSLYVSDGS